MVKLVTGGTSFLRIAFDGFDGSLHRCISWCVGGILCQIDGRLRHRLGLIDSAVSSFSDGRNRIFEGWIGRSRLCWSFHGWRFGGHRLIFGDDDFWRDDGFLGPLSGGSRLGLTFSR